MSDEFAREVTEEAARIRARWTAGTDQASRDVAILLDEIDRLNRIVAADQTELKDAVKKLSRGGPTRRLGADNVQGLTRDELWTLGKKWSVEANRCIDLSGDYKQLALYLGDRGIAKVDDLDRDTVERVLRGDLP